MKFLAITFFIIIFLTTGCIFKKPDYKKHPTESHILKNDKTKIKESIKHQKTHAKAAEKRKKEIDHINHKHRSDKLDKKIKVKKK